MNPTATNSAPALPFGRRPRTTVAVIATLVLALELAAALATLDGDPFAPVSGWGATRPTDTLALALVVVGCSALYWCRTRPLTALSAATASYAVFMLLGHELGLFLAPMTALYAAAVLGISRIGSLTAGLTAYAASLYWVFERTATVADPGAALLAWVAFSTVIGVFFAGPYVAGELVRLRRLLTAGPGPSPAQHAATT
ncbi:hypothetical protein [Nocardiopsis valliformis]|uniref:hypothetical protein n=1 Tax=Nocardiopsis valliformis TaxID=239974 RepID=UPI00034CE03E|nr:hypothetical protein [Nocardiopsis valliformis]